MSIRLDATLKSSGTSTKLSESPGDHLLAADGVPNGIRTRVSALKGLDPRPLDDGDVRKGRAEKYTRQGLTEQGIDGASGRIARSSLEPWCQGARSRSYSS